MFVNDGWFTLSLVSRCISSVTDVGTSKPPNPTGQRTKRRSQTFHPGLCVAEPARSCASNFHSVASCHAVLFAWLGVVSRCLVHVVCHCVALSHLHSVSLCHVALATCVAHVQCDALTTDFLPEGGTQKISVLEITRFSPAGNPV